MCVPFYSVADPHLGDLDMDPNFLLVAIRNLEIPVRLMPPNFCGSGPHMIARLLAPVLEEERVLNKYFTRKSLLCWSFH